MVRSVVGYLFGGPTVGGEQEARLQRWRAQPAADLALPHAQARYVVIHAVTSGDDPRRDRLIAIAALGVRAGLLDLGDGFELVLRQDRASSDANILTHGIGGETQLAGADPRTGMLEFLEFLGKAPLVALGPGRVDRVLVERAVRSLLGYPFDHPWIGVAPWLEALFPDAAANSGDDWLGHFGLAAGGSDHAVARAFAVAQLLQVTLAAAERAGVANAAQLLARQRLGRRPRQP